MNKPVIVIPARMASTRFPGKPLADLGGKPMVQWVYEACVASEAGSRICIATPDEAIAKEAAAFGAEVIITSESCPSGTDRIAEAAQRLGFDKAVNVQGDEPFIPQASIRACAELIARDGVDVATLYDDCPPDEADNPAVVKLVTDSGGWALYFSRHPIPYPRNERSQPLKRHLGIYGYSRRALDAYSGWNQGPLEMAESLEQLRFLENGFRILTGKGDAGPTAVDTPAQLESLRELLKSQPT